MVDVSECYIFSHVLKFYLIFDFVHYQAIAKQNYCTDTDRSIFNISLFDTANLCVLVGLFGTAPKVQKSNVKNPKLKRTQVK